MISRRRLVFALAFLGGMASIPSARAAEPTKDECISANDLQQSLRAQKKLRAARDAARTCANAACPAVVRTDCAQAVYDLDRSVPSMVFETKDAAGHDLAAVRVTMDGQLLADHLDGSALDVDVGPHEFAFESTTGTVRQTFIVREGDHARHERVTFPAPSTPPPPPPPKGGDEKPPAGPVDAPSDGTGRRVVGGIVGGIGLVSIVVGAVFVAKANASNERLGTPEPDICKVGEGTTCANAVALKSEIQTEWTAGGIAIGLGAAALVTGVIVFLTAPRAARPATTFLVVPSVGPDHAGLAMSGRF